MDERLKWWTKAIATAFERLLALAILVGVIVFAFQSGTMMAAMSWNSTETFYEFIYRVLLLVIGVELMRTLVTHDLNAILELLALVVARKMLKPELAALEIFLAAGAFVGLLVARRFLLPEPASGPTRQVGPENGGTA
jgi:ABC-type multidrug transport system permease subunit